MVMATVVTVDRPTSSDVVACIAAGVQGHTEPDGTFVGGVPTEIAWDNAAEFLSEHVTQMVLTLGILGTAVTPYAPYEKGKIESWHNTVQNELYASMPGFSHGPRFFSGRELWQPGDTRQLLTEDLLREGPTVGAALQQRPRSLQPRRRHPAAGVNRRHPPGAPGPRRGPLNRPG